MVDRNYELIYKVLDLNKPTGRNEELINEIKDKNWNKVPPNQN